jgi:hypothetical protein
MRLRHQTSIGNMRLYLMEPDAPEHSFRKDIRIVRIAILALILLLAGSKFGFEISALHFFLALAIAAIMYLALGKLFRIVSPRYFDRG